MDDNKICNEKQEALPNANTFNDEDILKDVLTSLKNLSTQYGLLVQEASHKKLHSKIETLSKEIGKLSREAYNLMFEKGWYPLEKIDDTKLEELCITLGEKCDQVN